MIEPLARLLRPAGIAAALVLSSACAAHPKPSEAAAPAPIEAPLAPARVSDEGVKALEARMTQFVADGQVKGIATRLIVDGKIVSDVTAGIRRASDNSPVAEDTIFRIYSMSKPVTGVALMMLYEQGAFTLDDPITKFVPEFASLRVMTGVTPEGAPILTDPEHIPTMREVMSHTAGFAYGLFGDDPANTAFREQKILSSPDLDKFIGKVAEVPLLFQPGKAWSYSASVDVQGYVVQKISGQSFGSFLDTRLFGPLGMKDTGFYVPEADVDRFSDVFGYTDKAPGLVPFSVPQVAFRKETIGMESGGGGLVSTMDDYTRFAQMLLNEGELNDVRVLKPETVRLMRTNMLPPGAALFSDGSGAALNTAGLAFGLNLGLIEDPAASGRPQGAGSYFWGGAAGTWFWVDPQNDVIFIGMIQRFATGGPNVDFSGESGKLVYGALQK
ncbi:serine hydrolase domain-containing protein [Hyphomonas sp.]|uniref:serine hydrolase domain-containing protein n=1 Tax=Hyphomonas sp. TaxID=87 RepID=UPI00334138B1